jgi:chromosome segregation ATPase
LVDTPENVTDAKEYLRKLLQDIEDLKVAKQKFDREHKEHFDRVARKDIIEKEIKDAEEDLEKSKIRLQEINLQVASKQQVLLNIQKKLKDIKASIPDG